MTPDPYAGVDLTFVGQMKRTREMLERVAAQRAKEGPREPRRVHPEDVRPAAPDMGAAIKRAATKRRIKRGR